MTSTLSILVTRPAEKGLELCQLIAAGGDEAIYLPTIAFKEPSDQAVLEKAFQQLGEQDWIIFVSPQAVYRSIDKIRHYWPHFSSQVKFASVGEGTAKVLQERGGIESLYPEEWSSEGLLNLPQLQKIAGLKIAIIRGLGGRELLDKTLAERGAQVLSVIAYERILPKIEVEPYLNRLKRKKIDVMIGSSYEGICHLKTLLGKEGWHFIKTIPLVVASERIKMLASKLGFQTIWVARNSSHRAMLEMLAQKRKDLWQMKT